MHSFENTKAKSTKRPGVNLNVDTGYKTNSKNASPPRTPVSKGARKASSAAAERALRVKTTPRETFLDDITPIDPSRQREPQKARSNGNRDTHGLELSPRQVTRDSLVDNMLLSLDQFSFVGGLGFSEPEPTNEEAQLYAAFGDEEPYATYVPPRNNKPPIHGHSYSSDYEGTEAANRTSSQLGRGRRSNSSSNIQTGPARAIGGLRSDVNGGMNNIASKPPQTQTRVLHSRGGKGSKGSKGSSANSFDLGYSQIASNTRWGNGIGGRSSSFDFGQDRSAMSRQVNTTSSPFYDYDAAPTPTIPVGPRRQRPVSPPMMYAPPVPKTLERKRSTRSSRSAYQSRDVANGLGINFNQGETDRVHEFPPLPAFKEPAPAPLVGYGKSKESVHGHQTSGSAPPPKERPGFFRRVFGTSKNNLAAAQEPNSSHGSTTSIETTERPNSKPAHVGNQMKPQPPLPREPPPIPKEAPHVIAKKPSSFFRRRKKSVSEPERPVPAPLPVPKKPAAREDLVLKPVPSPTNSLRAVMNPYLNSPVKASKEFRSNSGRTNSVDPDDEDNLRGFSPGYVADKNATIRAIKSEPRVAGTTQNQLPRSGLSSHRLDADSLSLRHPSRGSGHPSDDRGRSFLQDNSDNDREAKSTLSPPTASRAVSNKDLVSPPTQVSVARDKALVAEYERLHSKRSPTASKAEIATLSAQSTSPASLASRSLKPEVPLKDEEWIVPSPARQAIEKGYRVWLEPTSSEEDLRLTSGLSLLGGAQTSAAPSNSTSTLYKSATSLPGISVNGDEEKHAPRLLSATEAIRTLDDLEPDLSDSEPTEGDCERAKEIYDGNEDFILQSKAAAWLGDEGTTKQRTLLAYMNLYDFVNLNILAALRVLCRKLVLKAESQQVDRILDAFSKRWCDCNPNHGFKVADVVHTICYSILLLNTDLHLADIDSKMTRSQFVKNTVPTVLRVVADSAPGAFEPNRPSVLPRSQTQTFENDPLRSESKPDDDVSKSRLSIDVERPSRLSMRPPPTRTNSEGPAGQAPTPLNYATPVDDCGPLVKAPFHGTLRTWEVQVEIVLKDFYHSIRNDRLPLFGAGVDKLQLQQPAQSSLSVFTNSVLRRTPSVISKTPSEAQSFNRGRTADTVRLGTGKWASKNRSKGRVYPNSTLGSSRTSLDDQSMWSPSVSSSTWSKYSLGKTQTSMSVDSIGSNWPQGDYQQSIGFANALSQAIIREETLGSAGSDELRVAPLLEDESLELAGAPWAKEGIVKHKHHLESVDKKAKDRNWIETFVVIEKGYMSLFSFASKSIRHKSKSKVIGGVVGGGNWQDSAKNLGSFLLRQTIASALPAPGYSKTRPHVFALSLPTGAVHLFQVGTPEIVREFVSTANYWSARLSNHPLVGGISNIEFGWSDAIVNNAMVAAINDNSRPSTSGQRPSFQGSVRSSLDHSGGRRLPGDKIAISDWLPPSQSMRASNLMEEDQLNTLLAYVQGIEDELQKHNQLRSPMLLAFTPRQMNAQKAMANWEKKSSYLLREIVKFRTYMDCLQAAEIHKQRIYAEREAERAVRERDSNEEEDNEGDSTLRPS